MKASLFKRSIAFLADLSAAHLCAYALMALFPPPFEWSNLTFIQFCVGGYFLTGHLLHGRSLFQYLFHLAPQERRWRYTILKIGFISVAPMLCSLFYRSMATRLWDWLLLHTLNEQYCLQLFLIGEENARLICSMGWFFLLLIAETVCLSMTKKSLCELICGTEIVMTEQGIRKMAYFVPLALLLFLMVYEPVRQHAIQKEHGFKAYNAMPVYPPIPWLEKQRHVRSFRACQQPPEKYLMHLFDRYNIVFLVEREHPECLQWDFLTRFILSEQFSEKIGIVCIETANHDMQQAIDSFLHQEYTSDVAREMAAAHIIRECSVWPTWTERSLFDLFIRTNLFNRSHDSLHQIRICACDAENVWNRIDTDQMALYDLLDTRDSVMGTNVIGFYQEQMSQNPAKKKMLAIFNDIHCFRNTLPRHKNTIDYVDAKYPQHVGVCCIPSATYYWNGKVSAFYKEALWYSAAQEVGECFAVPIKGSILENKHLQKNLAPSLWGKKTMLELFDGMLFIGHPTQYRLNDDGYPYLFDPEFEKECLKRGKMSGMEKDVAEWIADYHSHAPGTRTKPFNYIATYNSIYIPLLYAMVSYLLLILLFYGHQMLRKNPLPKGNKP